MSSANSTAISRPSPTAAKRPLKPTKSLTVKIRLKSDILRRFPSTQPDSVKNDLEPAPTPSSSDAALPTPDSPADTSISNSKANTPAPSVSHDASAMPPPTEAIKKGIKRTSAVADGVPKVRGKPGPKKKTKLEDGSDAPRPAPAAHKLGPRAHTGAINAGLRALDRSGKPCRKWSRGGFALKSFTGVTWEVPRWRAPPKIALNGDIVGTSSEGSRKENKDSSQGLKSEGSGVPGEAGGALASSPAPLPAVAVA